MSRRTIYAVAAGSYSDYRVLALFGDRETAEQLATLENEVTNDGYYRDAFVEEMSFYETAIPVSVPIYQITLAFNKVTRHTKIIAREKRQILYDALTESAAMSNRPSVTALVPAHAGFVVKGPDRETVTKAYMDEAARFCERHGGLIKEPEWDTKEE